MDESEWDFIDVDILDREVEFQTEFINWLHDHPEVAVDERQFLSFSSRCLDVGLCGLHWQVITPSQPREVRSRWEIKCAKPFGGLQELELFEFGGDWEGDPLEGLEKHVTTKVLLSEIRCRGFICMQSVEVAESFQDVLNALCEFGVWFASALKDLSNTEQVTMELSNTEQVIMDDRLWEVSSRQSEKVCGLMIQAQQGSMMCRTAKEAIQEASKAAASVLDEPVQTFLRTHLESVGRAWHFQAPSAASEIWANRLKRDTVVLQWCNISSNASHIDCELEMEGLQLKGAQEDAARCVGIQVKGRLQIRIGLHSEGVNVSQEEADEGSSKEGMGTGFLIREIVKEHLQLRDEGKGNVFVGMLQEIAWYVSNLSWICAVCSGSRSVCGEARLPAPCSQSLCQATFSEWATIAPLELVELDTAPCVEPNHKPELPTHKDKGLMRESLFEFWADEREYATDSAQAVLWATNPEEGGVQFNSICKPCIQ